MPRLIHKSQVFHAFINSVKFTQSEDKKFSVSDEVTQEVADQFLHLPEFEQVEESQPVAPDSGGQQDPNAQATKPPTPETKAQKQAREKAEVAAKKQADEAAAVEAAKASEQSGEGENANANEGAGDDANKAGGEGEDSQESVF